MLDWELAKKLRDAGLPWRPRLFEIDDNCWAECYKMNPPTDDWDEVTKQYILLPRLDQLIAFMEERGYRVESKQDACYIFHPNKPHICPWWQKFLAENRTNAAGEALLWILQQEQAVD